MTATNDSDCDSRSGRHYWTRILLANAAGALAVVGVSGGFAPGVPWHAMGRAFGVAMVYANCIGLSMAIIIRRLSAHVGQKPGWRSWLSLIATMIAVTAAGTAAATTILFLAGVVPGGEFRAWLIGGFEVSLIISLIIGIAVTLYETARGDLEETTRALREKEREEVEARRLAAEAQLASLESRVHPHFLFNTLNSISELVHDDPAAAERVVGQLASLLRSSLDGASTPLVPLDQELRVVRDYLEIERVRFGDRLRYYLTVPDALASVLVPRLALQTMVENSVKYAVSPRREGASIVVRATASDGRVRLDVEDDGPGFDAAGAPDGHGLALVRSRLAMTFGDRASLRIESEPRRTVVSIDVPNEAS